MNHEQQAVFARALLDPALPCPPGLRSAGGVDAERRFSVHRNNVMASLVAALADNHPLVHSILGEPAFRALASAFVAAQPPRSPVLAHYGAGFDGFLEQLGPTLRRPWLADLARLEFARVQACHAADAPPLVRAHAEAVLARRGDPATLRLLPHPATQVVFSRHPVVSMWAAYQGGDALEGIETRPGECALVVRPEYDVLVLACDQGCASFVAAVQGGLPFGEAAAQAAEVPGFDLAATLSLLFRHGALAALAQEEEETA